jgi:endogenous inhibitor of DNA gyrase (YacG/DUF329 family)
MASLGTKTHLLELVAWADAQHAMPDDMDMQGMDEMDEED